MKKAVLLMLLNVTLLHFYTVSFFGIISRWITESDHVMLSFYKPIHGSNKVDYVFVVTRNNDLCISVSVCWLLVLFEMNFYIFHLISAS